MSSHKESAHMRKHSISIAAEAWKYLCGRKEVEGEGKGEGEGIFVREGREVKVYRASV